MYPLTQIEKIPGQAWKGAWQVHSTDGSQGVLRPPKKHAGACLRKLRSLTSPSLSLQQQLQVVREALAIKRKEKRGTGEALVLSHCTSPHPALVAHRSPEVTIQTRATSYSSEIGTGSEHKIMLP